MLDIGCRSELCSLAAGRPGATVHAFDVVDRVGGYPFEVATLEPAVDACRRKGCVLLRLRICSSGNGCNEYVFERGSSSSA